jgi:hypothetical protein
MQLDYEEAGHKPIQKVELAPGGRYAIVNYKVLNIAKGKFLKLDGWNWFFDLKKQIVYDIDTKDSAGQRLLFINTTDLAKEQLIKTARLWPATPFMITKETNYSNPSQPHSKSIIPRAPTFTGDGKFRLIFPVSTGYSLQPFRPMVNGLRQERQTGIFIYGKPGKMRL